MLSIPISLKTDANLALTIHQEHPDKPGCMPQIYSGPSTVLIYLLAQRLVKILKDIVYMLYTNGQPDRFCRHADRSLFLFGQLPVRG
tara:strand:- start:43 stop:303 length:261 start_codon:yes stop_codon:yes gene_type:complete